MISRTFDAETINALANEPSIRPHLGGAGEIDLTAAAGDRANVFLLGEHGGFVFGWSAPFVFDVHAMVLGSGAGKWARDAFELARHAMRDLYGAKVLWARIEPGNRKTALFARRAGFVPAGNHMLDLGSGPVIYDLYIWGF